MEILEFTEALAKGMQKELGEDYHAEVKEVLKNNSIVQYGIVVGRKDAEVLPCMYADELYERFSAGRTTVEEGIKELVRAYRNRDMPESFSVDGFKDYEKIRPKIRGKLINTEKNRELLQKIPHRKFLDLSLVYRVYMGVEEIGELNLCVQNSHLEMWGIGEEELFEAVRDYMEHTDEILLKNMEDMIQEILGEEITELEPSKTPVYILSTTDQIFGAVCMASRRIMEMAADTLGGDFTIIPSSVHELLLLPDASSRICAEHLRNMIQEVNHTKLMPSEVLSGHAYHYSRGSEKVQIIE
ncbi:MAG: DUF5688 family protein [Ruminococcus flavefaciens]|nr:DUF5688 family protein [Ruminococcus flavefaciens]